MCPPISPSTSQVKCQMLNRVCWLLLVAHWGDPSQRGTSKLNLPAPILQGLVPVSFYRVPVGLPLVLQHLQFRS